MRIGIDASLLGYPRQGIARYVFHLVKGLFKMDQENEYVVYGPAGAWSPAETPPNFILRTPPRLPYPVWEQGLLPLWAREDRLDLLHCPANTAPLRIPSRTRLVLTIEDVMYLLPSWVTPLSSEFRQRAGRQYRRFVVPRVAARAHKILTISHHSKSDIMKHLGLPGDRISVAYLAVERNGPCTQGGAEADQSFDSPAPDGRFVLAIGGYDPRKNTERIIRAYGLLRSVDAVSEKLVVVSVPRWQGSSFHRLAKRLELGANIVLMGHVSDSYLGLLYKKARCLVYPSLYEGFGLPVLEAMAAGIPVVTSAVSSLHEVAGDAAVFVDPTSEASIGEGLLQVLRDDTLRLALIDRGRRQLDKFRWETTVAQTLAVYKEVLRS